MLTVLFVIIGVVILQNSYAFSEEIKGKIYGYNKKLIYLCHIDNLKEIIIDSTITDDNSNFSFHIDTNNIGNYRIKLTNQKSIDILYLGSDIQLNTSINSIMDSVNFKTEFDNDFFNYTKQKYLYFTKSELLQGIIYAYPTEDSYYWKTKNEFLKEQHEYKEYCENLIKKYSSHIIAELISIEQPAIINPNDSISDTINYLKNNYFVNPQFSNPDLLKFNSLQSRIHSYLSIFINPNKLVYKNQLDLVKATDYLLNLNYQSDEIYNYVFEFLLDLFSKNQMESMVDYISLNHDYRYGCEQNDKDVRKKDIEKIRSLAIGKKSPEFIYPSITGEMIELKDISSKQTLIVFWSSECPYCSKLLSKLKTIYFNTNRQNLEIIAISIHYKKEQALNSISKNEYSWINIIAEDGWNSEICKSYNIYATPTTFLLDESKTIIEKNGIRKIDKQ